MKVIIVKSKKEWLQSAHVDERRYKDLLVVEDPDMDPKVFRVEEVVDYPGAVTLIKEVEDGN